MGYAGKIFRPSYWKKGLDYIRYFGLKKAFSHFRKGTPAEDRGDTDTPPTCWYGDYDSWVRAHAATMGYGEFLAAGDVNLGPEWLLLEDPGAKGLTYTSSFEKLVKQAMEAHPACDFIYTDEDSYDPKDRKFKAPLMKPDFSPDYISDVNYIGHGVAVKKSLFDAVGGIDPSYGGAAYYDLILRLTEQAKEIVHITGVLCHNVYGTAGLEYERKEQIPDVRSTENRYAEGALGLPEEDRENGLRAVEAHNARLGRKTKVVSGPRTGIYNSLYEVQGDPLVSIIIPNKDHTDDLDKCVRSLFEKNTYKHIEIIVVENNSTEDETFAYYDRLQKNPSVRVVYFKGKFNYSAINNFGIQKARGDYLLLLNNDTEIKEPDSIARMLGRLQRPDLGIVGAKLYYPDGTIQHGGVVVGLGGVGAHAFMMFPGESEGYMARLAAAGNYSAVTAACLMVKRAAYEEAGGLNEDLEVAFNDVDFCLRVRKTGRLIAFEPHAELWHYESKSRGNDDTPEKKKRFDGEVFRFIDLWRSYILEPGDPFYNSSLTLNTTDFSLKP